MPKPGEAKDPVWVRLSRLRAKAFYPSFAFYLRVFLSLSKGVFGNGGEGISGMIFF